MLKTPLLAVVVFFAAVSGYSQSAFVGRVTEVIDGKTVRLEISSGSIRAELQYVDAPEPEQQLYQVVKDHLKALTLGKSADFILSDIGSERMIGRLFVGGVDIGAQMLRDGAAWLVPFGTSIKKPAELEVYALYEQQAKAEKRGIWSLPDLQPAWEFRVAKYKAQKEAEDVAWRAANRRRLASLTKPGGQQTQPEISGEMSRNAWSQVIAGVGKEPYGLRTGYYEPEKADWVITSGSFVELGTRPPQKLECRAVYISLPTAGGRSSIYFFGFRALSAEYNFSKRLSRLTIVIDGRRVPVGRPHGFRGLSAVGAHELFLYVISKKTLRSMAEARNVQIYLDGFSGKLPSELKLLMKQLADAT